MRVFTVLSTQLDLMYNAQYTKYMSRERGNTDCCGASAIGAKSTWKRWCLSVDTSITWCWSLEAGGFEPRTDC